LRIPRRPRHARIPDAWETLLLQLRDWGEHAAWSTFLRLHDHAVSRLDRHFGLRHAGLDFVIDSSFVRRGGVSGGSSFVRRCGVSGGASFVILASA